MQIERQWHHYMEWEDWQAGMYGQVLPGLPQDAATVLAHPGKFYAAASNMVQAWPIATGQHLTDRSCNRRAWVGQAACCYSVMTTRIATIAGWFTLTSSQQDAANAVADDVITNWERGIARAETLFG